MRDAMLPLLPPLLRLAYNAAASPEYKAKVIKVKKIFTVRAYFLKGIYLDTKRLIQFYKGSFFLG